MDLILGAFSFRGRTNRQPYWLIGLAIFCAMFATATFSMIPLIGPFILAVGVIVVLVAGSATATRRIHDRGRSAWWLLIMYLPAFVLSGLSSALEETDAAASAGFGALALPFSIWILVDLGCLRGTVGANRFGADPLEPSPAGIVS